MNVADSAKDDTYEDKPLDPEVEAVRRKLARLLIVSIGIMIAGLMAVLFAIVYKMSSDGDEAGSAVAPSVNATFAPASDLALQLPQGASIVSHGVSGRYVTVLVRLPGGEDAIHIFNMETNRTVTTIAVETAP